MSMKGSSWSKKTPKLVNVVCERPLTVDIMQLALTFVGACF